MYKEITNLKNVRTVLYDQKLSNYADTTDKPASYEMLNSILNYDELEIHFVNNNGLKDIEKKIIPIDGSNGYDFTFTKSFLIPTTNPEIWIQATLFKSSDDGKTLSPYRYFQCKVGSTLSSASKDVNYIYIEKVIGIKY